MLSLHFYGSYEILGRVGQVTYKLKLLSTVKINHVFHISQLKRSVDPNISSQPLLTSLNDETKLVVYPEEIRQYRYSSQGDLRLMKW